MLLSLVPVEIAVSSFLSDFLLALGNKPGDPNEHVSSLTGDFASRLLSFGHMLLIVAVYLLSGIVLYSDITWRACYTGNK